MTNHDLDLPFPIIDRIFSSGCSRAVQVALLRFLKSNVTVQTFNGRYFECSVSTTQRETPVQLDVWSHSGIN